MRQLSFSLAGMVSLCTCLVVSNTAFQHLHAAEPAHKVLVKGLDNPSGLAVQPGSGHLFVAARDGVHRVEPNSGQTFPEITGYPTDIYGKGPKYNIGPLGVGFIGKSTLVVSDGSRPDGSEVVRCYKVTASPASEPQHEEKNATCTIGPITAGEASTQGEGNFYAMAINESGIYITANGDDTKGWVLKAPLAKGQPESLEPYLATKPAVEVDAPVGITFAPTGELVIGQMGEMNVPHDSLLTMYDAASKKLLASHKTNLFDIAGLAYSPKTGKLYAVDFAWADTTQGGLYELAVSGNAVKATKIASLLKPTALAFDDAGNLFVTVFGDTDANPDKAGQIVKFEPGL